MLPLQTLRVSNPTALLHCTHTLSHTHAYQVKETPLHNQFQSDYSTVTSHADVSGNHFQL